MKITSNEINAKNVLIITNHFRLNSIRIIYFHLVDVEARYHFTIYPTRIYIYEEGRFIVTKGKQL